MQNLQARNLPLGDLFATSEEWVSRLSGAEYKFAANQLYCGRAVTETLKAGNELGAEVSFLSAGLGVVGQYQRIPAYSLAASSGYPDSVRARVIGQFSVSDWWASLSRSQGVQNPLASFIVSRQPALTLIAMPASYVAMVAEDLASLPAGLLSTVRIVGPRRSEEVDCRLRKSLLPYDSRLDSPASGLNGTASDFPHRALRHFVSTVLPGCVDESAQCHINSVRDKLASFHSYVRPLGQRRSDDEIIKAIGVLWKKHNGRRSAILKELRSGLHIACEQSRFRKLADKVQLKVDVTD